MRGTTIELESAVLEMEGSRMRVVLEALDEPRISTAKRRALWPAWAGHGPRGPIDDGPGRRAAVIERGEIPETRQAAHTPARVGAASRAANRS